MQPVHAAVPPLTDRAAVGLASTGKKTSWIMFHAHRRDCAARLLLLLIERSDALFVQEQRLPPTDPQTALELGFVTL
jgi:hypothetical protein